MTNTEAISYAKGKALELVLEKDIAKDKRHIFQLERAYEFLTAAVAALDKAIPAEAQPFKVEVEKVKIGGGFWGVGTTIYKCPRCGKYVTFTYKYCNECGQALKFIKKDVKE